MLFYIIFPAAIKISTRFINFVEIYSFDEFMFIPFINLFSPKECSFLLAFATGQNMIVSPSKCLQTMHVVGDFECYFNGETGIATREIFSNTKNAGTFVYLWFLLRRDSQCLHVQCQKNEQDSQALPFLVHDVNDRNKVGCLAQMH